MSDDHPRVIINRLCDEHKVDPMDMLSALLESLQRTYSLGSMSPDHTALAELYSFMQLTGNKEFPKGLLHAIDMAMTIEEWMDRANAKNLRENHNQPSQADSLDRKAESERVLRLIIKTLIDDADRRAKASLEFMHAQHRAGKIKLFSHLAPKDDPDEVIPPPPPPEKNSGTDRKSE